MRDEDFERIMNTWADHETESAPEMHPTASMYRMVRARRKREKRKPVFPFYSRWAAVGTAVASLVVVAILYTVLFHPSIFLDLPSGQEVACVGQREGFASEKGVIVTGPVLPPDKGRGKGPISFRHLMFHFQKQDSRFVQGIDLRAPREEAITLTSADNYRLFLEPAQNCYVYIFQLTSSDILVKLFPNETYSLVQNPLRRGQTHHLPSEPNWFYLGENRGEERLYVIASAQPVQGLDELYTQYGQADDESNKQEALSSLIETLDAIEDTHPEEAVGWVLVFNHQ